MTLRFLFLSYNPKVKKILKGRLGSISSPSSSMKIQIMGGKVCLRLKAKHCWAQRAEAGCYCKKKGSIENSSNSKNLALNKQLLLVAFHPSK